MSAPFQKTASNRKSGAASSRASSPPENILEPKRAQNIAELTYQLWQSRGCPDGSPDEDWLRAERELQCRT